MDAVIEPIELKGSFPRRGLLLHLGGSTGEISPLPGFSRESLQEAEVQLRKILKESPTLETINQLDLYPSVYFGLKSALLDLKQPVENSGVKSYLLLTGSPEEILKKANQCKIDQLKIKIGHLHLDEALFVISKLQPHFQIRLDCNQKWSLEKALAFFSHFDKEAFDYVEEPLENTSELVHFPYPFALDESLRKPNPESLIALEKCKALILKPTLLGNLAPFLYYPKKLILTSSFEGPVGRAHVAKWIIRHNLSHEIHGLNA